MGIGKQEYDEIQIPEELSGILEKAENRRNRYKVRFRLAAGVAACAVLLVTANTPSAYAALSEIPVVGTVVKVFHIGTGGQRADGLGLKAEGEETVLKFSVTRSGENEQASSMPSYEIERRLAPERLVITVNGIRDFDPQRFTEEAEQSPYVKRAYREIYLDDSAVRVVLELEKDTGYEAVEYKEPGLLEIRLFQEKQEEREVWFVHSEKMEMSEELALLSEQLSEWKPSIAGTSDGYYVVSVGEFAAREEAEQLKEELEQLEGLDIGFSVGHCLSSEKLQ